MTAVQARLDVIRREMMGPSSAHDAALRLLQAKLAKRGKHVRTAPWHNILHVCSPCLGSAAVPRSHLQSCTCTALRAGFLSYMSPP